MVKISVIITIHNAEKHLGECLDSVLAQTFDDMEILCIDGASTDATPCILRAYASKDARIRIIEDTNASYGHKVNRGIQEAAGMYVSVLESDDMYEPYMLETLYETAQKYQADFVNADFTCFFDVDGVRFGYRHQMYAKEKYGRLISYKRHPEEFGIIARYWTGLFRRAYLTDNGIMMNESPGASFQDMSFRFLTSILADRAYHLDEPVYLYRVDNPGSSMHDLTKTTVIAEEHDFLKKELLRRRITDRHVLHNAYLWKYTDFRGNLSRLEGKWQQELWERYREELEKDRELLEQYENGGYGAFAGEMMRESQQRVLELLEQDRILEQKRRERLYHFCDDIAKRDSGQKLVIFGAGQTGRTVLELLGFMSQRICCLTDNNEVLWNTNIGAFDVLPPNEALWQNQAACYIIANKSHAQEMASQLLEAGVAEENLCIFM